MSGWRTPAYRVAHRVRQVWWKVRNPVTIGVRTIVTDVDGAVLMVRHTYGRDQWFLPGGGVQANETAKEAALREAREETGAVVDDLGAVWMLGLYANDREGKSDHIAVFVVPAGAWHRDDAATPSPEVAEVAAFTVTGLPGNVSGGTARRLAELFDREPINERW